MNPGNGQLAKWELLLTGEETDFYDCYRNCYDDLNRLGLFLYKDPELVKESIHLLFIELWKIRAKLRDVSNIREYTFTIFKRILYKQKTGSVKHWSRIAIIENTAGDPASYTASYEEMLIHNQENEQARQKLRNALPSLGERQRELIRLRYFEAKSIEEIASITSLTPRTIYNTIHNALTKLRELLG
ncbi:MAG: sigma-70 family RNA polymerase sigma factor [Chitinophagaceae bacterium]|nr:sigma-70 family RNA polymerase sigma factor [Chitinophagaceae bacterium]